MTRFKELQRINAAIENRNEPELRWAEGYCRMRLQIATNRKHTQSWRDIEKKIQSALQYLQPDKTV
jgi:hypothetical protein